nr:F-box domain, leucine-rich repeat domain, L domain-like protein [Tanacetum cinerariifolium]
FDSQPRRSDNTAEPSQAVNTTISVDVARSHGGEDPPPPHHVPTGCGGCFANRGKGKRKPNLGGRAAGRLHTRVKTQNLSLKEITYKKGPVPIRFEVRDKQTLMPLGDHAAHWSSYIGETQFDLRPHMKSPDWTEIDTGIQQHLQKVYNTNKAAFKAQHWVIDPETGTYNVEKIRWGRPEGITAEEWDKYIQSWNDPRNIARAAQNRQNRAKSTVISRQGSRSLARIRDEMGQSSATQEYPSLIDTFFVAHTVNEVFTRDEDRFIYEEMGMLEATGTYTDDEINRLARRGKQRGHIPGVDRVLPARVTTGPSRPAPESTLKSLHKKVDFMMRLFKSDSKYSDAFSQFESAGTSRSGGCGDDEESADDQEDEDEDGDGVIYWNKALYIRIAAYSGQTRSDLTFVSTSWRHPRDPTLGITLSKMSVMANTTPIVTTVTKHATKEKTPKDSDATPRVNIQDFCEEYYEDILPVIMDKIRRDKRKEVHARLDFGEGPKERRIREGSHNSSARTLSARYHNPSE